VVSINFPPLPLTSIVGRLLGRDSLPCQRKRLTAGGQKGGRWLSVKTSNAYRNWSGIPAPANLYINTIISWENARPINDHREDYIATGAWVAGRGGWCEIASI